MIHFSITVSEPAFLLVSIKDASPTTDLKRARPGNESWIFERVRIGKWKKKGCAKDLFSPDDPRRSCS